VCGYLRLVLRKVRLRRSIAMPEKPPGEAALCLSAVLARGICHYIFTVRGSASLKLMVDSAGRTISLFPV
jgi:hypothetical protein